MKDYLKVPENKLSPSTKQLVAQMQALLDEKNYKDLGDLVFEAECDDDAGKEIETEKLEQYVAFMLEGN